VIREFIATEISPIDPNSPFHFFDFVRLPLRQCSRIPWCFLYISGSYVIFNWRLRRLCFLPTSRCITLTTLLYLPTNTKSIHDIGIVLVLMALAFNSFESNYQEKALKVSSFKCSLKTTAHSNMNCLIIKDLAISQNELMLYSNGIGAMLLLPILMYTGEAQNSLVFLFQNPNVAVTLAVQITYLSYKRCSRSYIYLQGCSLYQLLWYGVCHSVDQDHRRSNNDNGHFNKKGGRA